MIIDVYVKERCLFKLLGELEFSYSSFNVISVKVKIFFIVVKDEVEVDDEEEFLQIVVDNYVELFGLLMEK